MGIYWVLCLYVVLSALHMLHALSIYFHLFETFNFVSFSNSPPEEDSSWKNIFCKLLISRCSDVITSSIFTTYGFIQNPSLLRNWYFPSLLPAPGPDTWRVPHHSRILPLLIWPTTNYPRWNRYTFKYHRKIFIRFPAFPCEDQDCVNVSRYNNSDLDLGNDTSASQITMTMIM